MSASAPSVPVSSSAGPSSSSSSKVVSGILKSGASKKRRSLVWDENNLDANEIERIERGPRMKIDEPPTPYQTSHGLKSPKQLGEDEDEDSCLAGTLPSEFSLGGGFDDVDSVQRREPESRSWESDDDDDERVHRMDETSGGEVVNDPLPAADGGVIVAPHPPPPIHTHPSLSVSPIRIDSSGAASPDRSSGDSSRAPSPTLEVKHQMFEKKRAGNYGHMGDLLKRRQQQDEDDDDE